MSFFAVRNLTELSMAPTEPWTFLPTETITEQIRNDKLARQGWYQNANTRHNFYTAIEPENPNQRPSKQSNPPRLLHGLAVDYDARISDQRVNEAVQRMELKPAWVERSLGGGVRLVWTLEKPIQLASYEFTVFLLQRFVKWLRLDTLPGLDATAFTDPTRLLCNGGDWKSTGAPPIKEDAYRGFLMDCVRSFNFKGPAGEEIPLEAIEKGLRAKYPQFSWPSDFQLETQGPSFWVEGSMSPKSAILKKGGFFTFSAHASKPFFTWTDLLGKDFVKDYENDAIAEATKDIWWDGNTFWLKKEGIWKFARDKEMERTMRILGLNGKAPKGRTCSQIDEAVHWIQTHACIEGAGPFVGRPNGITFHEGKRKLNTWVNDSVKPADQWTEWGDGGKFPLMSKVLDNLFDPHEQLFHCLAWWKLFYLSMRLEQPRPGQNVFLMGGAGIGKTYFNRNMVGASVGGFIDASGHLIRREAFNAHYYASPHWVVDDQSPGDSEAALLAFNSAMKSLAANVDHLANQKFQQACMTQWMGRVGVTSNLDCVSSRNLVILDNSSGDKLHLFRCAKYSGNYFPERQVLEATVKEELPYFLRWLIEWKVPDCVIPDVRYGFKSYHDPSLREQVYQGSKAAPFGELLMDCLTQYFRANPEAAEWRGTATQLARFFHSNPLNSEIIRNLRLDQTHRYLEMLQRDGRSRCSTATDGFGNRIWIFPRVEPPGPAPSTEVSFDAAACGESDKWMHTAT